ncbi:MAG: hypothetical protein HYX76_02250, partial [Acidobacteria bacterium]|nr:hypothetical protein [Acidobacteriota bacterium]
AQEFGAREDPFQWTEGYSLILTSARTLDEAYKTVDYINEHGGQVAIVASPRVVLGWAPVNLRGQGGIRNVTSRPYNGSLAGASVDEADAISFFNEVASGAWRAKKAGFTDHSRVVDYPSDVLEGPAVPPGRGFLGNGPGEAGEPSPGFSDLMAGKVSYNVIYIESNGAVDPNSYTWLCADQTTIQSEITASLSFWSSRALNYGVPLSFTTTHYKPPQCAGGTTNVTTSYEPITRPGPTSAASGDQLWINQITQKIVPACNAGDKFAHMDCFNSARRTAQKTNWATTQFIGYNPSPAATTFTDTYFAYAYRGGYYCHLLFRNDGWAVSQYDLVSSHETGHLFGAFDEYASSACGNCFSGDALSKGVVNGNCVNCNAGSVPSIMRNNEVALDGYVPGQIGWGLDINNVRTSRTTSLTEKTNWKPGQAIRYWINVDVPGRAGECVDVRSRWYRQFPNPAGGAGTLTEAEYFNQACLITSGGNRNIWLDRTVPAGAGVGEGAVEIFLELYYGGAPEYRYGNGMKGSLRGKFYVLNGSANAISTSPMTGAPVAAPGSPPQ